MPLFKKSYQKRKAKFDAKYQKTGEGYKYEFAPMKTFGVGSLALPLFILAFVFLFSSVYIPLEVVELPIYFLGFQINFRLVLIFAIGLFALCIMLSLSLSSKHLNEHIFADIGLEFSAKLTPYAIFLMILFIILRI